MLKVTRSRSVQAALAPTCAGKIIWEHVPWCWYGSFHLAHFDGKCSQLQIYLYHTLCISQITTYSARTTYFAVQQVSQSIAHYYNVIIMYIYIITTLWIQVLPDPQVLHPKYIPRRFTSIGIQQHHRLTTRLWTPEPPFFRPGLSRCDKDWLGRDSGRSFPGISGRL